MGGVPLFVTIGRARPERDTDARMAAPRTEHRLATVRTMGLAVACTPLLLPLLRSAGLVPLLLAGGVAVVIGAPAAVAEWRTRSEPSPALSAGLASIAEIGGLLVVASALASVAHSGTSGVLLAIGAWLAGALLADRPAYAAVPALAGLGLLAVATGVDLVQAPPWTLLEPHWERTSAVIGPAASVGMLLACAGIGQWTLGPARPPGERHAPWGAVGLGLGLATLLVVDEAARYERALGVGGGSHAIDVVLALALASATSAVSDRGGQTTELRRRPSSVLARAGIGLALSLALAGPAWPVRDLLLAVVLPAVGALGLGAAAARAEGGDRLALGAGAAVFTLALVASWPGVPGRAVDAVIVGAFVVAGFWLVATRAVLAGRQA